MSKIVDVLTKAGYTLQSGSADILPGTLIKDGDPIGFLMPDLTVSLVATHAQFQSNIEHALGFAIENQDLTELESGEYILTQFDKTILTVSYDYEEEHAVYKVYSINGESQRAIIDSYDEKAKATQSFAELSGLVGGASPSVERIAGIERIQVFIQKVQEKGYRLIETHEEKHKTFDITDSDGNTVGYIGANNKLTLSTDVPKHRKNLTELYHQSGTQAIELPGFFERLKEKLKEIGLALRVLFTPTGRFYSIHDKNHQVATVDEAQRVTYTPFATQEQMHKINDLVAEIQQEKSIPQRETVPQQAVQKDESQRETGGTFLDACMISPAVLGAIDDYVAYWNSHETGVSLQDFLGMSEQEYQYWLKEDSDTALQDILQARKANVALSDYLKAEEPALTTAELISLAAVVLGSEEQSTTLSSALIDKLTQLVNETADKAAPAIESPTPSIAQDAPQSETQLTELQQAQLAQFDTQLELMETLTGFNEEQQMQVEKAMLIQFGTTDRATLIKTMVAERTGSLSLQDKLHNSQEKAELLNGQRAPAKEQPEKER